MGASLFLVLQAVRGAMKVVVTGGAGFIGSHLSQKLLEKGHQVIAIDSMNPYYDVRLKQTHLAQIQALPEAQNGGFQYHQFDINEEDGQRTAALFDSQQPEAIIHLAAQAGVRYCQEHPEEAENNNIRTTQLLLDLAHRPQSSVKQFLFASSSSIYGMHERPWKETYEPQPEGIYGNSKKRGEEMCREHFQKDQVAIAAMRFFTVYGPFGRPDMAPAKFMDIIHRDKVVPVYGDGTAIRDFTYIEDIVQGIVLILEHPNPNDFEIYNLGKGTEVPNSVLDLIRSIEDNLHKKANVNHTGPMAGDVPATQADITKAQTRLGYSPKYELNEGIQKTVGVYLRHLIKHVIAFVPAGNNSAALQAHCDRLAQQQIPPASLLVLDYATSEEALTANRAIVDAMSIPVDYRQVKSGLAERVWEETVSFFEEKLKEAQTEAFEEPSNLFLYMSSADSETSVADLVESVSQSGWEVVGSNESYLVRVDAFLKAEKNTLSTEQRQSPDMVASLQQALQQLENLRVQFA